MQTVTDPVCGMAITRDTAAATSTFEGREYFFCSVACQVEFDKSPERYRHDDSSPEMAARRKAGDPTYTKTGDLVTPKFGSATSGGAEFEPLPSDDEVRRD